MNATATTKITANLDQVNADYGIDTPDDTLAFDGTCYRCNGTGYLPEHNRVHNGICFHCNGHKTCIKPCCTRTVGSLRRAAKRQDRTATLARAERIEAARAWGQWCDDNAELHQGLVDWADRVEWFQTLLDYTTPLSQPQMDRAAKILAERVAEAEAHAAAPDAPKGRVEVTGEVLSVKGYDTMYGYTLKMLVKDDRGFKVWGSIPSSLKGVNLDRGDRVKFVAGLEPKADDPKFATYKRSTKAERLATWHEQDPRLQA